MASSQMPQRLACVRSRAAAAPVAPHYRLLVFTCSAHAANLVVRTAICDDERNADNSPLVATRVRFFKYLMQEYAPEFVARLRTVVEARLQLHLGTPPPRSCRAVGWATRVVRQAGDSRQPLLPRQWSPGQLGALVPRCRPLQGVRSCRRGSRGGAQVFAFRGTARGHAFLAV